MVFLLRELEMHMYRICYFELFQNLMIYNHVFTNLHVLSPIFMMMFFALLLNTRKPAMSGLKLVTMVNKSGRKQSFAFEMKADLVWLSCSVS